MKKYAIITAGGLGTRMGGNLPKQFMRLHDKQILWYTLKAFITAYADIHIVLVLPSDHLVEGEKLMNELNIAQQTSLVKGGATRFYSVQNGLQKINSPSIVFVHDGVRCLVTPILIRRCYEQAYFRGSAIPAVASVDSVRVEENGKSKPVNRNLVRMIQTPQTFKSELLIPAFQQPFQDSFTDEATVVEASGQEVYLIEGEYQNIKITQPQDLVLAESILQKRNLL